MVFAPEQRLLELRVEPLVVKRGVVLVLIPVALREILLGGLLLVNADQGRLLGLAVWVGDRAVVRVAELSLLRLIRLSTLHYRQIGWPISSVLIVAIDDVVIVRRLDLLQSY